MPYFLQSPESPDSPMSTEGAIMAALAVIGGLDTRPRLGGVVHHEEFGQGTIANVASNGRLTIQFEDQIVLRICRISAMNYVSFKMI